MAAHSIFSPQSRSDFNPKLANGQRYRHPFGDKRLAYRYDEFLGQMFSQEGIVVNQLSKHKGEQTNYYRFLDNPNVTPAELIYTTTCVQPDLVQGKDLLVIQDQTSIGFRTKLKRQEDWQKHLGVLDDNITPGFYMQCSLLLDRATDDVLGLGDIVLYNRPLNTLEKAQRRRARTARRKLPLEQQESYVWALGALNCQKQLQEYSRITFVMDQGGDKYEILTRILANETTHAIWRSKENRQVLGQGAGGRLCEVLEALPWGEARIIPIRALNHYSKSHGKWVQRQGRLAGIKIRYAPVQLALPSGLSRPTSLLSRTVYVVQAMEDPSSVPSGEEPINWRLLTTWPVRCADEAWKVVEAYQARWFIEQLFRVLKKQGLKIEESQLQSPQSLKNQAIMAISTATKVMQLTLARDGGSFTPIETMFDEEEQSVLKELNDELSGRTEKQSNPHAPDSLAFAAWVIARVGGWKGYASQRPPGPITMKRGLEAFDKIVWGFKVLKKSKHK